MRSVILSLALLLSPLAAQACIDSVDAPATTTFVFPDDVKDLAARVMLCSTLMRLNSSADRDESETENRYRMFEHVCGSEETLEAAVIRVYEAHKDSPEIQLLLNNLPPYKD